MFPAKVLQFPDEETLLHVSNNASPFWLELKTIFKTTYFHNKTGNTPNVSFTGFVMFQALKCSTLLLRKSELHNRRTLDLILAKGFFYHSRTYELLDRLDEIRGCVSYKTIDKYIRILSDKQEME